MRLPKLRGFKAILKPEVITGQLDAIKKISIDSQAYSRPV